MGVCIHANNGKCPIEFDMGYGGFLSLREFIGEELAGEAYTTWAKTNDSTSKETLHIICKALHSILGDATYNFLTQTDCEGELTHRECKEMLDKIKPLTNNYYYGYWKREHSFEDFKTLLQYCYSHRTKLVWR